jgi:probable rRNA maturation factor
LIGPAQAAIDVAIDAAIDVVIRASRRSGARVDRGLVRRLCRQVCLAEGISTPAVVNVAFVDDAAIARINAERRGVDSPTDVLSFPLDVPGPLHVPGQLAMPGVAEPFVTPPGAPRELGDVVISYPRAVAQAAEYGHGVDRELGFLLVHGLLHILGYDHEEEADRARMRAREEAILAAFDLRRD